VPHRHAGDDPILFDMPEPAMRLAMIAATTLLLAACGSVEYKDSNAAVDARPECAQGSLRPGETAPPWCEREQSATWSSDSKDAPLDLSGKSGDSDDD
jgi:hypothetical protein